MSPHRSLIIAALLGLTGGCITFRTVDDGIARARLGETVRSAAVTIAPEQLVEDSRCPAEVECIRAGTVRVVARIDGELAQLALDRPMSAAGGTITLVEAYPPARAQVTRYPDEYRFGFRWVGPARK